MTEIADIESDFLDFCLAGYDERAYDIADRVLAHAEAREFLLERARDEQKRFQVFRVARQDVIRLMEEKIDWTPAAIRWLVDLDADWGESADFCAKATRKARELRNSARPYLAADRILHGDLETPDGRGWLHLYLSTLRYEFRYTTLEHAVETIPQPAALLDPYTHACYTAALLIQDKPEAARELEVVIPRGGDNRSVMHLLTDALRFAETLPGRGKIMLALLRRPAFQGHVDATLLRKEAVALRLLGRYDEALAAIDRSLMLLGPNDTERHDHRITDRLRIVEERTIVRHIRAQAVQGADEAAAKVAGEMDRVRRQVGENLLRIVEILGIFTALIALVIGGVASIAADTLAWQERAWLMAVFGGVSLGFFTLLRFVVRFERRKK